MNLNIWTKILKALVGGVFQAYGSMTHLMTITDRGTIILACTNLDSQALIPQ